MPLVVVFVLVVIGLLLLPQSRSWLASLGLF